MRRGAFAVAAGSSARGWVGPQASDKGKQALVVQLLGRQQFNDATEAKVRGAATALLRQQFLKTLAAEYLGEDD